MDSLSAELVCCIARYLSIKEMLLCSALSRDLYFKLGGARNKRLPIKNNDEVLKRIYWGIDNDIPYFTTNNVIDYSHKYILNELNHGKRILVGYPVWAPKHIFIGFQGKHNTYYHNEDSVVIASDNATIMFTKTCYFDNINLDKS